MDGALQPEQLRALEYLARKGTAAPAAVLHRQLRAAFSTIEQSFDQVVADDRDRAPAAGKWSPREILDHLVLSDGPAVSQLDRLLAGISPSEGAIPADLHRPTEERPDWTVLRVRLAEIHHELQSLVARADDEVSLEPKVAVELVVKVGAEAKHWIEYFDWKAFVQAIRLHTLEHHNQLQRTVKILRLISEDVSIEPYDSRWPELFEREKAHLHSCLPNELVKRIEHFGSTAVPGLAAKPIVDMLVEVTDLEATKTRIAPILEAQGYDYLWRPTHGDDGPPFYAWFIKRDPISGSRTHHIHMVEAHFVEHWDRLRFRDYLIAHPEVAREYERLKLQLASTHANDRVAYTRAKTDFIAGVMERARPRPSPAPQPGS